MTHHTTFAGGGPVTQSTVNYQELQLLNCALEDVALYLYKYGIRNRYRKTLLTKRYWNLKLRIRDFRSCIHTQDPFNYEPLRMLVNDVHIFIRQARGYIDYVATDGRTFRRDIPINQLDEFALNRSDHTVRHLRWRISDRNDGLIEPDMESIRRTYSG